MNPKWIIIFFVAGFILNDPVFSQSSRLDACLEQLKSQNSAEREKGAIALFHFADGEDPRYVVEALIHALDDPVWRVRQNVATALGRIKDERALEALVRKLNDENGKVRKSILHAFGDQQDLRVISHMIDRLVDMDPEVRWTAAYELGRKKSRAAIVPLIMVLQVEEKSQVRQGARQALMNIANGLDFGDNHSEWQAWLLRTLQEREGRIAGTSIPEDSSPFARLMVSAVNDEDAAVRMRSEEELIQMREQAFEYLFEVLKQKDWRFRRAAARILASAQNSRAIDPLMIATKDENKDVRETAKGSLETLRLNIRLSGDRKLLGEQNFSTLEGLKQAVRHKEAIVRRKAAMELGKIENQEAVGLLIIAFLDEDSNVQIAARDSLRQRKEASKVVDALIAVLQYESIQRKTYLMVEIIGILRDKKDPASINVLIDLLRHEDMSVRQHTIAALGAIGTTEALTPLVESLHDEVDFVRRTAAAMLAKSKDPNLIEPLLSALGDPDPYVRNSALEALVNITGQDFQLDTLRWEEWWAENKEGFIQ